MPLASAPPLPLLLFRHQQQHPQKCDEWLILNKCNGNGITEISGEAGSGKSQLCLSLCVSCVTSAPISAATATSTTPASNSNHHAMYISMGGEGDQSSQIAHRLHQMIKEMTPSQNDDNSEITMIMKRIHTKHVHNEEELIHLLKDVLPQIFQQQRNKFGILVLDSMAGIFRTRDEIDNCIPNNDKSYYSYVE